MHRLGVVVTTLILSTATARADKLSLPEAVETARAHHPTLKGLAATRAQLEAQVSQVEAAFKPTVVATGTSQLEYVDPFDVTKQTAPNNFDAEGNYNAQLTATQLLTDSGRTAAQADQVRALEKQAASNLAVSQLDVELIVVQAYLSALESAEIEKVSNNAVALVTAQLAHSQALYKTTLRPEIDVLSAKTQTAQAKLQLIQDEAGARSSLVLLANAIADSAPRALELVPVEIQPLPQEDQPAADLVKLALTQRTDLAGLRDAVASAEALERLARRRTGPSVSVSGSVFANGSRDEHFPGPPLSLRPGAGALAQLTITWDLYLGGSNDYEAAAARAQAQSARAEVDREEQQIMSTVSQAEINVHQAREALATVLEWRGDAERQLVVAQTRYDNNVGNFVELNDARTGLVTAQRQEVQARYALAQSRIKLARELGLRAGSIAH